jgi:anti-sigma factor RsiW
MDCAESKKAGAFHDGVLSESERAAYALHLESCAACRAEIESLRRFSVWMTAARGVSAPRSARRSPAQYVRQEFERRRLVRLAAALTSAAAMVILACSAALWNASSGTEILVSTRNWERAVVTGQFEQPANEPDDPLYQVLFREQH